MKKRSWREAIPIILVSLSVLVIVFSLIYINMADITSRRRLPEIAEIAQERTQIKVPEGVRIYALGEATHGNKEFQELKLEVFKKLVEEYDYKVFSIEDIFGPGLRVEEYISGRLNDVKSIDLASDLGCWIYHTEDIAAIIDYMREYNENTPEEEHLHFFGFDMQGITDYEIDFLRSAVSGAIPGSEEADKSNKDDMLQIVDEIELLTEDDFDVNEEVRKKYTPEYNRLKNYLESSEPTYEVKMAAHTVEIATGLLYYYDKDIDGSEKFYFRDRQMADNVKWYDNLIRQNGRSGILVTAHNGHIARIDATEELEDAYSFGQCLKNIYGKGIYTVGTEYYISVDNVNDHSHFSHEYTRRDHRFTSADAIAYQARFFDEGSFFLDYDRVREGTKVYDIISSPNYMGIMGEGYIPENDFCADNFRELLVAKDLYDAVIYYYKVGPIRVLDYG